MWWYGAESWQWRSWGRVLIFRKAVCKILKCHRSASYHVPQDYAKIKLNSVITNPAFNDYPDVINNWLRTLPIANIVTVPNGCGISEFECMCSNIIIIFITLKHYNYYKHTTKYSSWVRVFIYWLWVVKGGVWPSMK